MATAVLPSLPPELLLHILNFHPDLFHLWCTCRQVSRSFRSMVETVCVNQHLHHTSLSFDFDWDYLDLEELTDKCMFGVTLTFDRLSDDNQRAVFKDREQKCPRDKEWERKYTEMELDKWKRKMNWYTGADPGAAAGGGRFDVPPWIIRVGSSANDTALPGWEINYEAREMSVPWRNMYQCFFREAEFIARKTGMMLNDPSRYDRRDVGASSRAALLLKKHERDAKRGARKQIRRHRIKKFYKEFADFDFEDDLLEPEQEGEALRAIEEMEGAFAPADERTWLLRLLERLDQDEEGNLSEDEGEDEAEAGSDPNLRGQTMKLSLHA